MKKAYFAISYSNRKQFENEVKCLKKLFKKLGIAFIVFVDLYDFKPDQEKEMMKTAFREIDNADFLIAELTAKSIGVGIEIGYARAKEKPIIYVRRKSAEYSTTAAGSSTSVLAYENELDLFTKMDQLVKQLMV
mgnify:CR=1 FL=1